MRLLLLAGGLDPRNAAADIGPHLHSLVHQFKGARLPDQPVLRESHDLQLHLPGVLLFGLQDGGNALQPTLAVHIGKGPDVGHAVPDRQVASLADILDDPAPVVLGLERRGAADGIQRMAHAVLLVFLQGAGLTEAEKAEQATLRQEYVAEMKASLRAQLDHTMIQEPDGTLHKLGRRPAGPKTPKN